MKLIKTNYMQYYTKSKKRKFRYDEIIINSAFIICIFYSYSPLPSDFYAHFKRAEKVLLLCHSEGSSIIRCLERLSYRFQHGNDSTPEL